MATQNPMGADREYAAQKSIREEFEERENSFISPFGQRSAESRGRMRNEGKCPIRTEYQRDRDRIVYSNAFRRLKYKTQVFLSPLGDHYRTRLTHTLEVSEIARAVSRALRMNEDLAEAVALAHDLGHTPFGHGGETTLQEIFANHFTHSRQSLRVVDVLENDGNGLNLTYEVRDGILKHTKGYGRIIPTSPSESAVTVEGRIVRVADIIAYLNHDLDDALRSRVIQKRDIPQKVSFILGKTHSERATAMIRDIIDNSGPQGNRFVIRMSDEMEEAVTTLREFLYHNVYRSENVHREFVKAKRILWELYHHFLENDEDLERSLREMEMDRINPDRRPRARTVCDLIASMTDRYALDTYSRIFFPSPQV